MPRYIDADLLMKEFCDFVRPSNNSDFAPVPIWNDAVSLVGSAPTADVVEVVRCKECKHKDTETGLCEGRGWPMQLVPDDGFCDKGKRRTDDGET